MRLFVRVWAMVWGAVGGLMISGGFGWPLLVVLGINLVIVAAIGAIFDATEVRK